jgi:membrane-associated phospholipid phosphatase
MFVHNLRHYKLQGSAMNTIAVAATQRLGGRYTSQILRGFKSNRLLYVSTLVVFLAAVAEAALLGLPMSFAMVFIFSLPVVLILTLMIALGLGLETVRLARTKYDGPLFPALWQKLSGDYLAPERVANTFHATVYMSLFMVGYTFIKNAIPTANPYSWDKAFMEWDRILHFGTHPYEWLAPVFNIPVITWATNWNYNLWFAVMFGLWFWQGFSRTDHKQRQQFLLSFGFTWFLGGGILGTVFSSVGPCFYGRLLPIEADPYLPLMAWLNQVNTTHTVTALHVMDELWKSYATGDGMFNGISAMPSMHVGTSLIFVFLGFASGQRWLGWLLAAFASLIMLGSVHLGWHYAIDGYLGAAIAALSWWLAGKLVDWDRAARGVRP